MILGKEGNSRGLLTCTCLSPAEMFRLEKYEDDQIKIYSISFFREELKAVPLEVKENEAVVENKEDV